MSLSVDGIWKVGVWAQTVWADGVWREGAPPITEEAADTHDGGDYSAPHRVKTKRRKPSDKWVREELETAFRALEQAPTPPPIITAIKQEYSIAPEIVLEDVPEYMLIDYAALRNDIEMVRTLLLAYEMQMRVRMMEEEEVLVMLMAELSNVDFS